MTWQQTAPAGTQDHAQAEITAAAALLRHMAGSTWNKATGPLIIMYFFSSSVGTLAEPAHLTATFSTNSCFETAKASRASPPPPPPPPPTAAAAAAAAPLRHFLFWNVQHAVSPIAVNARAV